MSLPANIRINVGAPFPTRVVGASFIEVAKANGIWSIAPDYELLANAPGLTVTQVLVVFDPITGVFNTVNASTLAQLGINIYREIVASGDVIVKPTDVVILLDKTAGAATNIVLPTSKSRDGAPLTIKDLKGDANTNNITFVPASGETIDGFSASAAAANGVALIDVDYGKKTLFPLTSGGWYI